MGQKSGLAGQIFPYTGTSNPFIASSYCDAQHVRTRLPITISLGIYRR